MNENDIILSVIIVSYKALELLDECLESIERYNDFKEHTEIILADNSPDDDIISFVNNKYPKIKTIKNMNNGFGASNNLAVKESKGKYLLFLNPDTRLTEPIFSFAAEKFTEDNNLALFGIKLKSANLKNNYSFMLLDDFSFSAPFKERFYNKADMYIDGKAYICGADMFVRRSSFEEAGAFDENIFMYCEECDLLRRIKKYSKAKKTSYFKEKSLIHREGGTFDLSDGEKIINRLKLIIEARIYYNKKYNLSHKKYLLQKYKYAKFKRFCLKFIDRKRYLVQSDICKFYKTLIFGDSTNDKC